MSESSQVYGCIECGMLFAGWEFCLAHIEHCRPQHYLEVDKKTLKELCMIGHRRCIVPSYQPAMIQGDSSFEGFGDDGANLEEDCASKSSSEGSAGETTLTQDFLNPVEDGMPSAHHNHHHNKTSNNILPNLRMFPAGEQFMESEQRDDFEGVRQGVEYDDDDEEFDAQEKMVLQLFDREDHKFSFLGSKSSATIPTKTKQPAVASTFSGRERDSMQEQHYQSPLQKQYQSPVQQQHHQSLVQQQYQPPLQHQYQSPVQQHHQESPVQQHYQLPVEQHQQSPEQQQQLSPLHQSFFNPNGEDDFPSVMKSPDTGSCSESKHQKKLHRIERSLHRLIREASPLAAGKPKMVLLGILPRVYEVQFGTKLEYHELGFSDLRDLIDAMPSISLVVDSPYLGIEHEYIRLQNPNDEYIIQEQSDDETQPESDDKYNLKQPENVDKYNPNANSIQHPPSQNSSSENLMEDTSLSNEKTPQHSNYMKKRFSFSMGKSSSGSSEESLALQPISEQSASDSNGDSRSRSRKILQAKRERGGSSTEKADDDSVASSTISSCGSSKSVIHALAEMLPNTNAYASILRVLSRNHKGTTIGKIMVQAPEFKNFLSHCTDRRCEAQIKLAHSVLQQCHGISYQRTANGNILYNKALNKEVSTPYSIVTSPKGLHRREYLHQRVNNQTENQQQMSRDPAQKPLSIATQLDSDDSSSQLKILSEEAIDEVAARLFAASEFVTPTSSPRREAASRPARTNNADGVFRKPQHLDTISTQSVVYSHGRATDSAAAGSRGVSPRDNAHAWANPPHTPRSTKALSPRHFNIQSPATTLSREQSIAESAAKMLAEAQSMTTPTAMILAETLSLSTPTTGKQHGTPLIQRPTSGMTTSENAEMSLSDAHEESTMTITSSSIDRSVNNNHGGSTNPKRRMYFFTDAMSTDPEETTTLTSLAPSATPDKSNAGDKGNTAGHIGRPRKQGASKAMHTSASSVHSLALPDEVIEKIAVDLFPTTNMHYRLLVALAEHPGGMTWDQINALIPPFSDFVERYAAEKCRESIDPQAVLDKCVSVDKRQVEDRCLFFINAPDMMPTGSTMAESNNNNVNNRSRPDEISSTSDMTEESSTASSGPDSINEPLVFSLTYAGSDIMATLCFLRRLKESVKDRPWPTSYQQAWQWLMRFDEENGASAGNPDKPSVTSWLDILTEEESAQSRVKTRRQAMHILLNYLQRLKCVSRTGPDLSWNPREIASTLAHTVILQQQSKLNHYLGKTPVSYIETKEQLQRAKEGEPFCYYHEGVVTVSCEGAPDDLHVIQIGTESITYIFDCVKLGTKAVCAVLSNLFKSDRVIKAFHDVHHTAVALAKIGGIAEPLKNLLDTQIAMEALTGVSTMSFNRMLRQLGIAAHPITKALSRRKDKFCNRPISKELLSYAADHVDLLLVSASTLIETLRDSPSTEKQELWSSIQSASEMRAVMAVEKDGRRSICFDVANQHNLSSLELLLIQRPTDMYECLPLSYSNDAAGLLSLLPGELVENVSAIEFHEHVSSIMLDQGRPAMAWFDDHQRVNLGQKDRLVTASDIETVANSVDGFKQDGDLAGLNGQLHCISAVRNPKQELIGLTMRVGRHVTGVAAMISDLLFADPSKSILFIGEAGSGKTTALRDVARLLSERTSVSIVDTTCEIGGYSDSPHPSIGMARRFMVDKREDQARWMNQCFRNQRPRVLVVDELESLSDVNAAIHCQRRGARLIAATMGTLHDVMEDYNLSVLIGGIKETRESKQRATQPVFDAIVELRRGALNEWRVIPNTLEAVDSILEHKSYMSQLRIRDPEKGSMQLELDRVCMHM
ncbi:AAA [Seminavis robusta]|uniref:AAA n=1 Tax=Seminavis robusta TaxID=568900 RepID=A0A9N8DQY4_9STRA|nr:AAA [Seminavis robusta]|eukprot:Sro275_g105860.1 AAA (1825) ;mRNA; r:70578-76142